MLALDVLQWAWLVYEKGVHIEVGNILCKLKIYLYESVLPKKE